MAKKLVWIGGAPGVAKSGRYALPLDIEGGQVMTATIGNKSISYTFPSGPIRKNVAAAFVALWETTADTIPEFTQIEISDNADGSFTLVAADAGVPYLVTILIGAGTNEKQVVTLEGTITGGTFTLTFDGQATDPIANDADAATMLAALEALSNIESGDVTVTGDGPWIIEFTGNLADTDVALLEADDSLLEGTNEQQTITLASCSGGTFALGYGEETTDPIAYNADAATVESELEALPGIGAGNVSVSGTGPWVVEFIGTLRGTDVDQITVDGSSLTGVLAASVGETTPGGNGVNEKWYMTLNDSGGSDGSFRLRGSSSVTDGTFTIQIERGGETVIQTGAIPYDANPATVQAAIEAGTVGDPNTQAANKLSYTIHNRAGTDSMTDSDHWLVVVASHTGDSSPVITIDNTNLTGGSYTTNTITPPVAPASSSGASSFYIMVDGQTTDDIPADATAAEIVSHLEALSTVGVGNVAVTRSDWTSNFTIEFIGDLANQSLGLVTGSTRNIASNSIPAFSTNIQTMWTGSGGTSEVQTLSISGSPGSGTFALSFDDVSTSLLDFDSTAEEIETALEGLPGIGAGNVVCTGGALPGSDVVITFAGSKAGIDVDPIEVVFGIVVESVKGGGNPTVDIQTTQTILAKTVIAESSGPNDWNTAANWDTGTLPENDDTVIIPDGANILYGLDQSGLSLALLEIHRSDTQIGLPRRTDDNDIEYLPRYLKLTATKIVIGLGAGSGSQRINIDYGSSSPEIEIYGSASGQNGEHAIQLIGVNSVNTATLLVLDGDVGVATGPKEAAYLKQITQRGGQVWTGSDVGLEGIDRTGGLYRSDRTIIGGLVTL